MGCLVGISDDRCSWRTNLISEMNPELLIWVSPRQANQRLASLLNHMPSDLQQLQVQSVELPNSRHSAPQLRSHSPTQPVGNRMQDQPECVHLETRAAQPIGEESVLEVLYPIFHLSSLAVESVHLPGKTPFEVGDHIPLVGTESPEFRLGDHSTFLAPDLGAVLEFGKPPTHATFFDEPSVVRDSGHLEIICRASLEDFVFAPVVEFRKSKASVPSHEDTTFRPSLPDPGDHALENSEHSCGGTDGSGPEHRKNLFTGLHVVNQQRMVSIGIVVAVEKAELLGAVGGIPSGVEVENQAAFRGLAPVQPVLEESEVHSVEAPVVDPGLETRNGGLAGKVIFWIGDSATASQFEGWVAVKMSGIIGVFVSGDDAINPLSQNVVHRMRDEQTGTPVN